MLDSFRVARYGFVLECLSPMEFRLQRLPRRIGDWRLGRHGGLPLWVLRLGGTSR